MLSHGLTTSGLFLAIGVLYERRHTRQLSEFGGLWAQMPVFAAMFLICVLGSAGLPGLSGFVGEFLTVFGTFITGQEAPRDILPAPMWTAAAAATGVILGAVYLLHMFQKVMFGPLNNEENKSLPDLNTRELAVFAPLVALIFFMGVYPTPFLKTMEPSVKEFVAEFQDKLNEPDGPAHLLSAGADEEDHAER